jgi:hypothetical protein
MNDAYTPVVLDEPFGGYSYGLGLATRDEAGYRLETLISFETWEGAQEYAAAMNRRMGLTDEEATEIVLSSMRVAATRGTA